MIKSTQLLIRIFQNQTIAFFVIASFLYTSSFAQSMRLGESFPIEKRGFYIGLAGITQNNFYGIRYGQNPKNKDYDFLIDIYSTQSLNKTQSIAMQISENSKAESMVENAFVELNALQIFYSSSPNEGVKRHLFARNYSLQGDYLGETKVDSLLIFNESSRARFLIRKAKDTALYLIQSILPLEQYKPPSLNYTLYAADSKQVFYRQIEIPVQNRNFELQDALITQEGECFFLLKIIPTGQKWKKGVAISKYILLNVSAEGTDIKEFEISLEPRSISNVKILSGQGKLIIAGFYSEKAKSEYEAAGCFYIGIDIEKKDITSASINPFSSEIIAALSPKPNQNRELENYNINQLYLSSSGNVKLICEQSFTREVCYSDPRTGLITCVDYYYNQDIFVLDLNRNGKVAGFNYLPKIHSSISEPGQQASYLYSEYNYQSVVFFNDHPKNLKLKDNKLKVYDVGRKGEIVSALLGTSALALRKELEYKDKDLLLMPTVSLRLDNGKIIVLGLNNNSYRIVELSQ